VSHGQFSGEPRTLWLTADGKPDRQMQLLDDFWFIDPRNRKWRTPAEYVVDGASIPRALWTVVGSPYTGDYRRASIVHDKACDDAAHDAGARRAADRMFYHACRAGGCSVKEAILLYIGVRIGALKPVVPAWRAERTIESEDDEPRVVRTAFEHRLEADFQLAADDVLRRGETDDPDEIERRTDEALSVVTGIDVRGK
jgi:hypothetical protein